METLNAMHNKMHGLLAAVGGRVDAVFFCPHTPADACDCRKPASGLFRRIGERYGIDLRGVPAVGDSARDAVAALAAGCVPHLVRTGKSQGLAEGGLPEGCPPECQSHADLAAFVDALIGSGA
jgi:D-glycero-D-manno-heptose 1,7-bisphosphate phosphatase